MQASLFEPSPQSPLVSASDWVQGMMSGEVAVIMCTLAVGAVGAVMLTGRLMVRRSAMAVLGSFMLLGAPVIAGGLFATVAREGGRPALQPSIQTEVEAPRRELPEADYDPYSGA